MPEAQTKIILPSMAVNNSMKETQEAQLESTPNFINPTTFLAISLWQA